MRRRKLGNACGVWPPWGTLADSACLILLAGCMQRELGSARGHAISLLLDLSAFPAGAFLASWEVATVATGSWVAFLLICLLPAACLTQKQHVDCCTICPKPYNYITQMAAGGELMPRLSLLWSVPSVTWQQQGGPAARKWPGCRQALASTLACSGWLPGTGGLIQPGLTRARL